MTITPIGLAFVALFAVALVRGRSSFVWAIAVSLFFQDSAMLIVAGVGLTPYTVALLVALVLQIIHVFHERARGTPVPGLLKADSGAGRWMRRGLLVLLVYGVVVSSLGPWLFHGVQIMPSQGASDYLVDRLPHLTYTLSNAAQIVYLVLNAVLVWFMASLPRVSRTAFLVSLAVTSALILAALVIMAAKAPWPYAFFDNSPRNYYSVMAYEHRFRAQFAEPSHLALFLCGALAYAIRLLPAGDWRRRALSGGLVVVGLLAFLSNRSTTIVLTLAVLIPIAVVMALVRYRRRLRERRTITATAIGVGLVATAVVAFWGPISQFLGPTLVGRIGSSSQYSRGKQDLNALSLFAQTFGVGVGLGSNRSSSLLTMLLSDIGAVGTIAYYLVVLLAVVILFRRGSAPEAWALSAIATACAISVADFVSPPTWFLIGVAAQLSKPLDPAAGAAHGPKHRAASSVMRIDEVPEGTPAGPGATNGVRSKVLASFSERGRDGARAAGTREPWQGERRPDGGMRDADGRPA